MVGRRRSPGSIRGLCVDPPPAFSAGHVPCTVTLPKALCPWDRGFGVWSVGLQGWDPLLGSPVSFVGKRVLFWFCSRRLDFEADDALHCVVIQEPVWAQDGWGWAQVAAKTSMG